MTLNAIVRSLYRALHPCEHDNWAAGWFKAELYQRGIVVSRQTLWEWLNVELPEGRRAEVEAVLDDLRREAHRKAVAGVKAVEKIPRKVR